MNSSSGLVEPHILQDGGHQLLNNTTRSNTTHTADCSSKALDTAPTPRIASSPIHPCRLDGSQRRNPSLNLMGISVSRSRPEIDQKDSSLHHPCSILFANGFVHEVTAWLACFPTMGCVQGSQYMQPWEHGHKVKGKDILFKSKCESTRKSLKTEHDPWLTRPL